MSDDSDDEATRLHQAGATVRHDSPFARIDVPEQRELPPEDFKAKWVIPFYQASLGSAADQFAATLLKVNDDLDQNIVLRLLTYFNWRPRIAGAYLAAVRGFTAFDHQIGKLLLRSDLCNAAEGYCLALASFNTEAASNYLSTYLEYYLSRSDLWFDQGVAMAALRYLDMQNGTKQRDQFMGAWQRFVANKPNWSLERSDDVFEKSMGGVLRVARQLGR